MAQTSKWDAGLYDEKHSFVWKMAGGLLELLDAKPGERILDIGCGTGHLTAQIAATAAHVIGVDRSAEMIRQARAAHPSLQFEVADARELSFARPFDAIFSNATLHWITEPDRAVAAISSALRPSGRFVAEFGGKGNIAALIEAFHRAWKNLNLPGPFPNPWYYPSLSEYDGYLIAGAPSRRGFPPASRNSSSSKSSAKAAPTYSAAATGSSTTAACACWPASCSLSRKQRSSYLLVARPLVTCGKPHHSSHHPLQRSARVVLLVPVPPS